MMNTQQKSALNKVARWENMSFPNGSAYRQQYLPTGSHKNVGGYAAINIESEYNYGYIVKFFDGENPSEEITVSFAQISVGDGTDFGASYCSRDQALADLR